MRLRGYRGVGGGIAARLNAFDEFRDMRRRVGAGHAEVFELAAKLVVRDRHTAAVARLDPAFFADVARRARAKTEPAGFAHNELHAVVVVSPNVSGDRAVVVKLRLVTNRRGVVFLGRPLAEVDGVRTPFEDPAAVEVVFAAPVAADVRAVVRTPRARAEPTIPIDFVDGRFRFGGINILREVLQIGPADLTNYASFRIFISGIE